MNAREYFNKHGYKHCKSACIQNGWLNTGFWVQLKRLVESHELVILWRMPESWRDDYDGDKLGLDGARMYLDMHGNHELVGEKLERFKQAIADVEACKEVL